MELVDKGHLKIASFNALFELAPPHSAPLWSSFSWLQAWFRQELFLKQIQWCMQEEVLLLAGLVWWKALYFTKYSALQLILLAVYTIEITIAGEPHSQLWMRVHEIIIQNNSHINRTKRGLLYIFSPISHCIEAKCTGFPVKCTGKPCTL